MERLEAIEYFTGLLRRFEDKPDDTFWGKANNATTREAIDAALSALAEVTALRERCEAMEADLKHGVDNCDICKHNNNQPADCDVDCFKCTRDCECKDCRNEDKWEWRGAQGQKGAEE